MRSKIFTLAFTLISLQSLCIAQFTKLLDLDNIATGKSPLFEALITDGVWLYGTTSNGGLNNDGTLFKIKMDGTGFTKLLDFDQTITGNVPSSGVISDGTYLYGTTKFGGASNFGVIYKIKTDGTGFDNLHDFTGGDAGFDPLGRLFYDGTSLYGMTPSGGLNNIGILYKLNTDGTGFEKLLDFDVFSTGSAPTGSLTSDGTYLYGTAATGGTGALGTLFKIKPDGTGFAKLIDFVDDPNGAFPYGDVIYDSNYLYGMTNNGGEENQGTIFKVKTDGTDYQKFLDFDDINGGQPLGSLILQGTTLYGVTELGGTNFEGVLFQIETDGSGFNVLMSFETVSTGAYPEGTLLYADGALFGVTAEGGVNDDGVIFRFGDLAESISELKPGSLSVYPNPANGAFTITMNATEFTGDYALEIWNARGEKIYTKQSNDATSDIYLDAPAGIYFVKASNDNAAYTSRFVME